MTSDGRGDCTHDRRCHALILLATFASRAADDHGARPAGGQPALRRFAHRHQISPLRTPEAATGAIEIVVQNGGYLGYDPDAPTPAAEWVKHNLSRIRDSLPNGYCGRPPQQDCPHPNACLTCPSAARVRGIRAASAHDARGRTSHNPPVVGSSPTCPT